MSNDLIAFIRARLDEDEQTARAVEDGSAPWDGQWVADGSDALRTLNGHVLAYGHRTTDGRDLPVPLKPGLVDHIARHDPERVQAEVDAKRRILIEHQPMMPRWCSTCDVPGDLRGREHGCTTVRLLALPYADHPDYRKEWRP